ncbi:MAG: HI0074 family nucleotidyltransferase substrate-binding subunit [Bryobacterales bacterium]|nr:HI0074 family nucleotidyltransferase substrate-binding subunit [Bryobacterales bacterium]
MRLDYSALERATAQLQKSFRYLHSDLARQDSDLREQFRSATIQALEYTYELAVKMIRRQLSQIVSEPAGLRRIDFADVMRVAADAGIISDARAFLRYREIRNKTSHTYNSDHAERTVDVVDDFLRDVDFLLRQLASRNRGTD